MKRLLRDIFLSPSMIFAFAVIVLVILLLVGCISPRRDSPQDQSTPIDIAEMVRSTIKSEVSQVQNEVWPWVTGLGIVALIGGVAIIVIILGVLRLIKAWIRSHSYLEQKPKWLQKQNGKTG